MSELRSWAELTPEEQQREMELLREAFGVGKVMRDTIRVERPGGTYMLVTRERPWPVANNGAAASGQTNPQVDH